MSSDNLSHQAPFFEHFIAKNIKSSMVQNMKRGILLNYLLVSSNPVSHGCKLMLYIYLYFNCDKLDRCVLPVGVMLVNCVYMCELSRPAGSGADGLSEDSGRTYRLVFVRPPRHCQASHILCKYALVRSSAGAFSPVRSPQILISQVTVVDFQPVCAADINHSSFTDKFKGGGPFLCISCHRRRVLFATSYHIFF